ncbi:uncharacterized protein PG998_007587 [Apiospora kogelbergensis]|uniref:uncharacterized protein n=1 Tax=Apiospora kogelbergensis TaxID=1337665 RepID=UPI0031324A6D
MSQKTQEPVVNKLTELATQDAKWITLKKIDYTDQTGKDRTWEPPSTLLVIQYRPPLDAYTVEWPAGLIDADETAEQAAVREFKEETGYDCKLVSMSPVQSADPGMSDANMKMAMVEVHLGENDPEPEQRLEDGEHIERVVVPLAEFYDRLVEYSKKDRFIVAAKLFHFAHGMHFAQTQTYM